MIRIGCKNAVWIPLKKDLSAVESESGKAEASYDAPVALPNVQSIELTVQTQSTDVDSDDSTETLERASGYSGTITRNMLSQAEAKLLLGEKAIDGINVSASTDESPYGALGFMTRLAGKGSDGKYTYILVLKAKFGQGDFSASSSGDSKIEAQPDKLSFKSTNRHADDAWRFWTVSDSANYADTFFTAATCQKLANVAKQSYTKPCEVEFVTGTLPTASTAVSGKIYIKDSKAYYFDGTSVVEA